MTIAEGPESIVPEFMDIVSTHTSDFSFSPSAQRLLRGLLRNGSAAVYNAPEEDRLGLIQEYGEKLNQVAAEIAGEMRQHDMQVVDLGTLEVLLQARCAYPPFCYGAEDMKPLSAGASETFEA
jgi:hypothetical protein